MESGQPEAHVNLGNELLAQGKLQDAIGSYRRAIELKSDLAEAHYNLGVAFQSLGLLDEAVASYRRTVELNPGIFEAHNNLGNVYQEQGKLADAVACFRRAQQLNPDSANVANNLGNALKLQGKLDEAVACFQRALELNPNFAAARDNHLLTLHYQAEISRVQLLAAHAEYDRFQTAPLRACWQPHRNDRDLERPLRLGFVSPDFCRHPVGFLAIRALENLGRSQCETVCYSDHTKIDDLTDRFQSAATIWRDVRGRSDQELADDIRADQIDILFDLAGHTAHNRLLVFARKPAPVQITWAGYPGTTGLAAMDFILADRYEIPLGAEPDYRERVLRMPDGYVCYTPPDDAPPVSSLPAINAGHVTFGSFNNRPKITSKVVKIWAKILNQVPQSRLVLKNKGFTDTSISEGLAKEFGLHGIDRQRLEFLDWSPHRELLAAYGRIDIALDPFPYNGGLTTCEALWMGVPLITCSGETFASRHSLSHLSNVGLTETIACDLDEYVELVVELANDLPRLAALRAGLRARMAASPLCDGKRFAENLLQLLRDVWRQWCYQARE